MATRKSFLERGLAANRNLLAIITIAFSIIAIIIVSWVYIKNNNDAEATERVFSALLPLFATWVGTVLAFYFGRENFEAASERYEQIITKLSPEVLDDIEVSKIMITEKTMVKREYDTIKSKTVKDLVTFLELVDKSRLPILEAGKPKYVIHKPLLDTVIGEDAANANMKLTDFETKAKYKDEISCYVTVSSSEILESVISKLNKKKCKNGFVIDEDGKVVGWVTDTLIFRYIGSEMQ